MPTDECVRVPLEDALDRQFAAISFTLPTMMLRLATLSLLVATAAGFVLQNKPASSSALAAIAPEKEVGVLPPVGFFEYVVVVVVVVVCGSRSSSVTHLLQSTQSAWFARQGSVR